MRTRNIFFFLLFPFQYVSGDELDELIVENIQNFAANYVKFGLLSRQIVLEYLYQLAATVNHVCNCDSA